MEKKLASSGCYLVDLAFPAKHKMKIKETEKIKEIFGPKQRYKKKIPRNMRVTLIPIVVGVTKGLEKKDKENLK